MGEGAAVDGTCWRVRESASDAVAAEGVLARSGRDGVDEGGLTDGADLGVSAVRGERA